MEIEEAIDSIIADMGEEGRVKYYILHNFSLPLSYLDEAFRQIDIDHQLAKDTASELFSKCNRKIGHLDGNPPDLILLIKDLSFYESQRLKNNGFESGYSYTTHGKEIIQKFEALKDPEKFLVEHYFGNTINSMKSKIEK